MLWFLATSIPHFDLAQVHLYTYMSQERGWDQIEELFDPIWLADQIDIVSECGKLLLLF